MGQEFIKERLKSEFTCRVRLLGYAEGLKDLHTYLMAYQAIGIINYKDVFNLYDEISNEIYDAC